MNLAIDADGWRAEAPVVAPDACRGAAYCIACVLAGVMTGVLAAVTATSAGSRACSTDFFRGESSMRCPPQHAIDIDRARVAELALLPEIGPALAARIVAERGLRGAFGSVEALQRVEGIGPVKIRAIKAAAFASGASRERARHEEDLHRGADDR